MATYAIIDSSQRVGFHRRLEERGIEYRSLFDGHAEQKHIDIAPLLLKWSEFPDRAGVERAQADLLHLAKDRPAVSFIESDCGPKDIAEHLRRFHLIKLPNGREMLLRWYDTRVLPVWMEVMTPAQSSGFLGSIDRWRMFDRYGDEVELAIPPETDQLPALPQYSVDEMQYTHLIDACGADVLIAHLRQVAPDQVRAIPMRALYPFVQDHLAQARRHGLLSLNDQGHYLLLALSTSSRFLEHDHVRERLILREEDHEQPFSDWAMNVPDSVFDAGTPFWMQDFTGDPTP